MTANHLNDLDLRSRVLPAIALALLPVLAGLLLGGAPSADAAKAKTVGQTKKAPKPSCPGDPCEAIGSVTGFQQRADGKKGLFKLGADGHLVAWSVKLSKPDKSQRKFFGDFYRNESFGAKPSARLAVLKPKGKGQFKLKKDSPAVALGSELGGKPIFTLRKPMKAKKGDVVALTIPTWLSNFAVERSRRDVWRASRSPDKCTGTDDIKDSRTHTKNRSTRKYGCRYSTARILYWAYFVKSGKKK